MSPQPEAPSPAPTGGQVFSLPPLAAPPLVLPTRPALHRRLRVAGGDPFQLPLAVPVAPAAGAVFALGLAAVAAPAAPLRPTLEPLAAPAALAPAKPVQAAPPAAESPAAFAPVEEAPLAPPPPLDVPWWRPAGAATAPALTPAGPASPAPAPPPAEAPAEAPSEPPAAAAAPPPAAAAGATPAVPAPPADGVEVQPSGALPAPELRPSDPGTATLGELYLRQGHLGEARKIFHQVLERDPNSEAALRGLESIARRRTAALGSSEPTTGAEPEVKGLTSRKILLLQKYLHQLRAAAARQPSSGSEMESGSHVPGAAE